MWGRRAFARPLKASLKNNQPFPSARCTRWAYVEAQTEKDYQSCCDEIVGIFLRWGDDTFLLIDFYNDYDGYDEQNHPDPRKQQPGENVEIIVRSPQIWCD